MQTSGRKQGFIISKNYTLPAYLSLLFQVGNVCCFACCPQRYAGMQWKLNSCKTQAQIQPHFSEQAMTPLGPFP